MKVPLDSLRTQLESRRSYDSPPLHLWHPDCNGDIPIFIDAQGNWYHDGGKIERHSLVCLFASILRREDDGEYYLVTPHEKWRIEVERHPLLITDINAESDTDRQVLVARLNTGRQLVISEQYPLYIDPTMGDVAAMHLPHQLTAVCTRSAWYRLVDMAEIEDGSAILRSGSYEFKLSTE